MELIAVGTGDTITAAGMAGITSPSGEISLRTKLGCHVWFQVEFILYYSHGRLRTVDDAY